MVFKRPMFQARLFLGIIRLVLRRGIVLGKESALGAWGWSRRVTLIKSLIYARKKRRA